MSKRNPFQPKPKPITKAITAFSVLLAAAAVQAGPGFGDAYDLNNIPFTVPTFFASSPSGDRWWVDATGNPAPLTGAPAGYDPANQAAYSAAVAALYPNGYPGTGRALRKFVDPLPLLGAANARMMADGVTQKYIPVAVPKKWVNPQGVLTTHDYYEIAAVEYTEKMHSDLRKPTTLRGYVQIDQEASNGRTPLPGSKSFALTYPNGSAIMIRATDANGKLLPGMVPALAFDAPHYLGPVITATKDTPTRIKFLNLLPAGRAVVATDGSVTRNGDVFLPVDPSIVGAGFGPDGMHTYTSNRVNVHLHGGDNPWISDGTPHQWITPAGEADMGLTGSLANDATIDPSVLPNFLRGAGAVNVPDMNDPGTGAMTYYFPNGESARMEWYHDHTVGITRLNVYAGLASAYLLTDPTEQDLIARGVLPGPNETIPLVLQDKTFVPDDIALQDARWHTTGWGAPGDLWYPHVYETVQDPGQATNFNAVGRWHWGPYFWPSFPSAYNLPSGAYGDATTVPEAWGDTPLVNGVAYPTLAVEPKPYRLRILNASNDRFMTFNMFVADDSVVMPGAGKTEIKMVPVQTWTNLCAAGVTKSDGVCTPETWTTDVYGHNGGVPDPTTQGPTLFQIASEGGLLPGVAVKDATPISYLLDKGRAAVLNVDYGMSGLQLGNAERADVVVDFSKYAGKTLIVYNDSGAPVPAADPRNEYFTGYGDNSATGGAEDTRPGYGPNTRTMMQIVVAPAVTTPGIAPIEGNAANFAALDTNIKAAYKASQETPVVAQSAYNAALGTSWTDSKAFGSIFTGSLKEPVFSFVPGTPNAVFNSIKMVNQGSGYTRPPSVALSAAPTGGVTATAKASLKISALHVINGGSGYKVAPVVTLTSTGPGSGAMATATLGVSAVQVTAGGAGYTSAPVVTFSAPTAAGGVRATGTAVISAGAVRSVNITNAGSGYSTAPTVTLTGGGGTGAKLTSTGSVATLSIDIPDPTNVNSAGGGGYTDLSTLASEPNNLTPGLTMTFTAPPAGGVIATAGATGKVFDITLVNAGKGYTTPPTVSVTASPIESVYAATATADLHYTPLNVAKVGATAQVDTAAGGVATGSYLVKTKAIQELFEPTYGRLNATLGVEIPYTSALTQTTIPLGYVDAPTEEFADGETQIWKITHNGVDTHPVHFHLLNVQLINRVGWDNFVTPPEANELGWKETVKMSPLEDVIVAVRAKKPKLAGFGLPNSVRLLDPTQPEGAMTGFTQIDSNTGVPAPMSNTMQDFGWEYVWHCHILGHEENDFMRPIIFHANEDKPLAPSGLGATASSTAVQLGWTDNAATEYQFNILRATGATSTAFTQVGTALANAGVFADANVQQLTTYRYQVVAVGANGTAASNIVNVTTLDMAPNAPTSATVSQTTASTASLSWVDQSSNETSFALQVSVNGGAYTALPSVASATVTAIGGTVTVSVSGLVKGNTYTYQVAAVDAGGSSAYTTSNTLTAAGVPVAPSALAVSNVTRTLATLSWLDGSTDETQFVIQRSINNGTTWVDVGPLAAALPNVAGGAVTFNAPVINGNNHLFRVAAVNSWGSSAYVTSAAVPVMIAPVAPTATTVSAAGAVVTFNWTDNSTDETSFVVQGSLNGGAFAPVATLIRTGTQPADSNTPASTTATLAAGTWTFQVVAVGAGGTSTASAWTNSVTIAAVPTLATPTGFTATLQASNTTVALRWLDGSNNETGFVVESSLNGGAFTQIGTVTSTARNVTRTGTALTFNAPVVAGSYVFRVKAVNATGNSAYVTSAAIVVTPVAAPAAPTAVRATSVIAGTRRTVTVSWTDASTNETGFIVERCNGVCTAATPAANWTQIGTGTLAAGTGTVRTFNDTRRTANTTYSYAVIATGNGGLNSTPVIVTVTTQP